MANDSTAPKGSITVQETLYQTEQALRSSEERYRSVVEHSPAGILLIDKLGGEVEVTSENKPGQGSTFSFILPQATPAPSSKH